MVGIKCVSGLCSSPIIGLLKAEHTLKNLKIISFSKKTNADVRYIKTIKRKSKYILFLLVNNKIQKLIVKEKLISYLDNILAAVAVISNLLGFRNISMNDKARTRELGQQLFPDSITFAAKGGIMNTTKAFQRVA